MPMPAMKEPLLLNRARTSKVVSKTSDPQIAINSAAAV